MPQNEVTYIVHGRKLHMVDGELSCTDEAFLKEILEAHEWMVETGNCENLPPLSYDDDFERYGNLSYARYIGAMLNAVYKKDKDVYLDRSAPLFEDGVDIHAENNEPEPPGIVY